jgi:hypothetical protein
MQGLVSINHMLADIFVMVFQSEGFSFGFVEFESQQSMYAAIEVCSHRCLSQSVVILTSAIFGYAP